MSYTGSQDALFKVCLYGSASVGKTSLVQRYLTGIFSEEYSITVGVDFHIKRLEIEGKKITLQIWDFAGEDRFRFLLPSYIKGSSGGIFMYDITNRESLEDIDDWLEVVNNSTKSTDLPILLVGGKLDLQEVRQVSRKEASELRSSQKKYGQFIHGIVECSAKTGESVDIIFEKLSRIMMEAAGLL